MSDFSQFEEADFTTDYLGEGARYRLPRRQLGRLRCLGWIVVAFGIFLTLFSVVWLAGTVLGGLDQIANGGVGRWLTIGFGCVGLFIFVQALVMLSAGIAVLRNRTRCDVHMRGGVIAVKERFSLFRLRRRRAAIDIKRLRIAAANERKNEKLEFDSRAWLGDYDTALIAETKGTRRFLIAVAYPRELLVRLAEELAPRLDVDLSITSPALDVGKPVSGSMESSDERLSISPAMPEKPVGSTASIERRDSGITIDIPPAGLRKGSKGLFAFALLWNAFISIFVVVGTLTAIGVIKMEGDGPPWIMLVGIIPFVAVGIGLTVASINMGRRHATIATADDLVIIVRHSIFGKSTREMSADEIATICVGNSGMEVNDVPVKELQIHPNDGKKFGCLSQLDDDELIWIAAELNQALAIRCPSDPAGGFPSIS